MLCHLLLFMLDFVVDLSQRRWKEKRGIGGRRDTTTKSIEFHSRTKRETRRETRWGSQLIVWSPLWIRVKHTERRLSNNESLLHWFQEKKGQERIYWIRGRTTFCRSQVKWWKRMNGEDKHAKFPHERQERKQRCERRKWFVRVLVAMNVNRKS